MVECEQFSCGQNHTLSDGVMRIYEETQNLYTQGNILFGIYSFDDAVLSCSVQYVKIYGNAKG